MYGVGRGALGMAYKHVCLGGQGTRSVSRTRSTQGVAQDAEGTQGVAVLQAYRA